ncbi:hypothetical protein Trydic_g3338 [Trypoxylus dichotomus]
MSRQGTNNLKSGIQIGYKRELFLAVIDIKEGGHRMSVPFGTVPPFFKLRSMLYKSAFVRVRNDSCGVNHFASMRVLGKFQKLPSLDSNRHKKTSMDGAISK